MTIAVNEGPVPWLTPLVHHRLESLGPGSTVDRPTLHRVAGSARAGDQFLYAALRVGLLVPTTWGRYAVPRPATLEALRRIPDPTVSRLISHAQTLPWILREAGDPVPLRGFLGGRLWGALRLEVAESAPVYALPPGPGRIPSVPMQGEAFLVDSLDSAREFVGVRLGPQVVRVPVPSVPDTVRLYRSSLDPRLTQLSGELLRGAPAERRRVVHETKPRWSPPRRMPVPSRAARERLPAGPPQNYRLFAPAWYVELMRGATEAFARGRLRVA